MSKSNFLILVKEYEELKEKLTLAKSALEILMQDIGEGNHFQDPTDNVVYQIIKPKGTFISFSQIGYERTKKQGEVKGSLSIKRAEELGYTV